MDKFITKVNIFNQQSIGPREIILQQTVDRQIDEPPNQSVEPAQSRLRPMPMSVKKMILDASYLNSQDKNSLSKKYQENNIIGTDSLNTEEISQKSSSKTMNSSSASRPMPMSAKRKQLEDLSANLSSQELDNLITSLQNKRFRNNSKDHSPESFSNSSVQQLSASTHSSFYTEGFEIGNIVASSQRTKLSQQIPSKPSNSASKNIGISQPTGVKVTRGHLRLLTEISNPSDSSADSQVFLNDTIISGNCSRLSGRYHSNVAAPSRITSIYI